MPDPRYYELRLQGHLDERWSNWFGLALTLDADGTTTLRGVVADQAQLHGLLAKIRDLGVPLISVMPVETASGEEQCPSPHRHHSQLPPICH